MHCLIKQVTPVVDWFMLIFIYFHVCIIVTTAVLNYHRGIPPRGKLTCYSMVVIESTSIVCEISALVLNSNISVQTCNVIGYFLQVLLYLHVALISVNKMQCIHVFIISSG